MTLHTVLAILGMAVSGAFAGVCAALSWRGISVGRRSVDGLGVGFVFLGVQSLHAMLAGLCGCLDGAFLGVSAAVGLAVALGFPGGRRRLSDFGREFWTPSWRAFRCGVRRRPVLALAAFAAGVFLAWHGAMFIVLSPPLTFDALTYHLGKVAQWIHSGSLALPDLPVKRVFWPSGMELLNAWWAVFLHHELLIETPGLFFHALAVAAVWAIARGAGFSRALAGWAAVLFSVTPAVVVHGTTCLTDLPTAAVFLYLLALWSAPATDAETARRRWWLSAAAFCYGLGVKPTIAFMAPGLLVAAWPVFRKTDFSALSSLFRPSRAAMAVAVAAAFLGGFWYVRNAVLFGNPLYPVVMGTETEDGIQSGAFSLQSLRAALSMLLVEGGILDGRHVIPNLYRMTGWGWTAVCCGIPCSVWMAFRSRRFAWLLAGQVVAVCVVLSMVRPDFSCLRFLLWVPAILCIGAVGAAARPGGLPRPVGLALAGILAWTSLCNMASGLGNATGTDWAKQLAAPGRRQGRNASIQARLAHYVPPGEDIAVFMYREGFLYLVYGPSFSHGVYNIEAADEPVDFARALDEAGLRFLFFEEYPRRYPAAVASLREQLADGRMTDLGVGLFVRGPDNPGKAGE